jgi:hypothetical protein
MQRLFLALAIACSGCGDDGGGGDTPDASLSAERPTKRSDIAATADPDTGIAVIFGGDDGPIVNQIPSPSYRDDTWVFDPSVGWSQVTGAGPSARGRYAAAHDPDAGRMLLFGGRFREAGASGNYTLYDDLWAFDYQARAWTQVDSGGEGPTPRYFPAAVYSPVSGQLVVWGGDTNPSALTITPSNEVWSWDGSAWTQETATGQGPSSRLFVAYAYDSQRDRLVVFGGQVGDFVSAAFNDLYALDLGTFVWSRLHDGAGTAPSGRFSAAMAYDAARDRYLAFGGHADPGVSNEVWAFDPAGGTWSKLGGGDSFTGNPLGCMGNDREIPQDYVTQDLAAPERRSTPMFAFLGDTVWLYGGESDCSDHLDDTWRLAPDGTWTEVIEARTGESCARAGDDCQCLCL